MKLKLLVFYGSVRSTRQGIKAARFVANKCRDREHEVFLVDPFAFRLPLLDKIYKEYPPGGATIKFGLRHSCRPRSRYM